MRSLGRTLPLLLLVCGVARGQDVPAPYADARVTEAAAVLLRAEETPRPSPPVQAAKAAAIEKLGDLCEETPEAPAALVSFLTQPRGDQSLKQRALLALGMADTPAAVDGIRTFEAWAAGRYVAPPAFHFDDPTFGNTRPERELTARDGTHWAVFRFSLAPAWKDDCWITVSRDGAAWALPLPVSSPKRAPAELLDRYVRGKAKLASLQRDTDGDGLPDALEQRLGTDSKQRDTDGDGLPDGLDSNPLTPACPPSEFTRVRQALFTMLFATSDDRRPLLVLNRGDFAAQEYSGWAGPVIPVKQTADGWMHLTNIEVKLTSPTTAEGYISYYGGFLTAGAYTATLERRQGRWVVITWAQDWNS